MSEQTEDQMARALIDHVKRTHTPRLALLEDRIAEVLRYMDGVDQPNPVTLAHIRAYLTGGRDSLVALAMSNKIDEIEVVIPKHKHTFSGDEDTCTNYPGCPVTWTEDRMRRPLVAPAHEHVFVDHEPDSMCIANSVCVLTWHEYRTRPL